MSISIASPEEYQRIKGQLSDWRWRINNLYWITNKAGKRTKFEMNWAQEQLWNEMWYCNVILKARQLGFTTFIQIFMLDAALFTSDIRAGIIAHTRDDARVFFRDKVKFPYDNLPEALKRARHLIADSAFELSFSNNSSIRVGTSLRSGTLQYLHISEYGKLCAKSPERAREVRTGALNAVQAGQVVFIESTAEGQEGHFFELCEEGQAHQRRGDRLTELDFKFFFFPWWKEPAYRIDSEGVTITPEFTRYFDELEAKIGVKIDASQRAWYVKKAGNQLDDMKREFPSTPEEAFEAAIEGAYYGAPIATAETQGRVGEHKAIEGLPVHSAWDIGRSDYTSIWFWQRTHGQIRVVGFFQNCQEGMPFYAKTVKEIYERNGWSRNGAIDYVPHDARVTEWGSNKSRLEQMKDKGLKPVIPTELSLADGINAVRDVLPICLLDKEGCGEGIKVLKSYRKDWDENLGMFRDVPRHDINSHGADAFRTMACAHRDLKPPSPEPKPQTLRQPTLAELTAQHDKSRRRSTGRIS